MLNIALCDDEALVMEYLKKLLVEEIKEIEEMGEIPEEYQISLYTSGEELISRAGDHLSFTYEGKEKLKEEEVYVYTSSYDLEYTYDPSGLESERISIPYDIKLDYYISPSKKEVVQVCSEPADNGRAYAVMQLLYEGRTLEEAEKEADKMDNYETFKTIMAIKNFGGDIKIDVPEGLPE